MTFAGQDGARLGGEVFHAKPMEMAYAGVPMYTGYAHGECCSADDLHKQQT